MDMKAHYSIPAFMNERIADGVRVKVIETPARWKMCIRDRCYFHGDASRIAGFWYPFLGIADYFIYFHASYGGVALRSFLIPPF